MKTEYEVYQWPEYPIEYISLPSWVKDAIATKHIRLTSDFEDAHVRTPMGEVRLEPGEVLIKFNEEEEFSVLPASTYVALTSAQSNRPIEPTSPTPPTPEPKDPIAFNFPAPPYSSSVLARSAQARAKQAEFDALPPERQEQLIKAANQTENAHVEGADQSSS